MDHTPPPASAPSAEATNANWAAAVWHQALAPHTAGLPAVIGLDEQGRRRTLNWPTLRQQAASLALALQDMGLQSGDVVALYLPHVPEVVVAMVACASMGVVCSHCHPLLETAQVLDRWRGLRPKVLLGADGLYWGGQPHDRAHTLHELRIALPSLQQLVVWRTPYAAERVYGATDLGTLCARDNTATQAWVPVAVPAQHPLWLEHRTTDDLTLPPQAVAHSHADTWHVQQATWCANTLRASHAPDAQPERLYWAASPQAGLWPLALGGLVHGTTVVLYDGHPCGDVDEPDTERLWRQLARQQASVCITGAGNDPGLPPAPWADALRHVRYLELSANGETLTAKNPAKTAL
ncbi:MAG: AMP-binding protein [Macromonas sp.]